jgi:hypothetical protein
MNFVWNNCGNVQTGCCGAGARNVRFDFFRKFGAGWIKTFSSPYALDMNRPSSSPLRIPLQVLCNTDMQAEIKISAVCDDGSECNRV